MAFDATGLRDVVDHQVTGYLAEPFSSDSLAAGIHWTIEDFERNQCLAEAARRKAVDEWSPETVAERYREVYECAIGASRE